MIIRSLVNQVLEQYFDEENIVYWMAFQILTGNVDTQSRNMYLYSPQNSDTWYFIDWDNDGLFHAIGIRAPRLVRPGKLGVWDQ